MTLRASTIGRLLLPVVTFSILLLVTMSSGDAQTTPPSQAAPGACPGQQMPMVLATGVYMAKPVPDITINGKPAPGAFWEPGMRSYWHCHVGGQIMMLHEGVGRVQKRGERAHALHKGDTEYAGPGVEHWHGAAPDGAAHFFQTGIGVGGALWMEEVSTADYMGNDIGITSRNEFLRTGVRQKGEQTAAATAPAR
jgi:hypothetical protein